jgi:hypothetical protein
VSARCVAIGRWRRGASSQTNSGRASPWWQGTTPPRQGAPPRVDATQSGRTARAHPPTTNSSV